MAKIKKQINKYSWDLEAILEGKSLETLYDEWKNANENLVKTYDHGKCFNNVDKFDAFIKSYKKLHVLSNRLMNYVSNNLNEDIANPTWAGWQQKIIIESKQFAEQTADLTNMIIANKEKIQKYLNEPKYKPYTRFFELSFREEKHILSKQEEQLLTSLSVLNNAASDVFDTLTRSEIKFDPAYSKAKKPHKINTLADVAPLMKSNDRELRKTAWLSEYNGFYRYKNTLAKTLYHAYLNFNTNAKIRKHKDYVTQTAFEDEIDPKFIQFIYEQVAKLAPLNKRYSILLRKALKNKLKVDKVEPWDTSVPLFNLKNKYTIEDAQKIALDALKPMGTDYLNMVQKAFNENWISWLPKVGKQTGAYSIGGVEGLEKYYISMNFDGTLRSVYTIVHELGHSMHSWKLLTKQKIYTDVSIFYAEISSIANEMLLNHYLLKKYHKNSKMKVIVLNEMIQNFFATTTRQIMFSDFEYQANQKINNGEEFGSDSALNIYADMYRKYLGYSQSGLKKLKSGYLKKALSIILAVPHFYAGIFYVYKYAVGQIAAIIAAKRIMNNEKNALKNFMTFLESGNSLSPLETIKLLDIDLENEKTWQEAFAIVEEWITLLNAELKKTKII